MKFERKCDNCQRTYVADTRNIKRGWGLCCSKSCAASKREKSKPGYNESIVADNNEVRKNWNCRLMNKSEGDISFADVSIGARYQGRTSEGYRIYDGVAYDPWGIPIYDVTEGCEDHPFSDEAFNG
jgi:hypothetical protein